MINLSMREMLEAGVHFGHRTRYWQPAMAPYIYGARNQVHVIDLEKTLGLFTEALQFVEKTAANRGKILFVGTKYAAQDVIQEQAKRCGMPYVASRWLGGMLTNYKTVRQSIKRLKTLEKMMSDGLFEQMIKKEALQLSRQLDKLSRSLGGIKDMGGIPDALFVVDVGYEKISVTEANRLKIPVIGVVDTNNSPENIDYIIPGNDDSMRAIEFYARSIADTIIEARKSAPTTATEEVAEEAPEEVIAVEEIEAKFKDVNLFDRSGEEE